MTLLSWSPEGPSWTSVTTDHIAGGSHSTCVDTECFILAWSSHSLGTQTHNKSLTKSASCVHRVGLEQWRHICIFREIPLAMRGEDLPLCFLVAY